MEFPPASKPLRLSGKLAGMEKENIFFLLHEKPF